MKRYAISNIHGNCRAFEKLLDYVDPDPEQLVIVGDLGDRGLQTWEVYKECALLLDEGAHIVRGNHDEWLAQYLKKRLSPIAFSRDEVGGITTIKSLELANKNEGEDVVEETMTKVLNAMQLYYEDDDFIFVHAGLDPRVPYMDQQKKEVLLSGCVEWRMQPHTFDQFVVFGHTPTNLIHSAIAEDDTRIWTSNRAKKIAIDTGAGFGCRLTMVDLWDGIAYAYDFDSREIIEYQFRRKMRR